MAKIDERLKQVHETSLTESRLNEDFLEWLKTKGPSVLLAIMVGVCVYLGVLKWRQYKANRTGEAWSELLNASLPSTLEDMATKYADVQGIANEANMMAADALLQAVQADRQIGGGPDEAAMPAPLGDDERQTYLKRARDLYTTLVKGDDASLGAALRVSSAMQGLAAIAECSGEVAEAKSWYDKAAARVDKSYPDLARRLRERGNSAEQFASAVTLPAQASLPARTPPKVLQPAALEESLRTLLFPVQPSGG